MIALVVLAAPDACTPRYSTVAGAWHKISGIALCALHGLPPDGGLSTRLGRTPGEKRRASYGRRDGAFRVSLRRITRSELLFSVIAES